MFLKEPVKAGRGKRAVYLVASSILGGLLGVIGFGITEIDYLKREVGLGNLAVVNSRGADWPILQIIVPVIGLVCGFFLGRFWWRKIYVEKAWKKNKKN